MGQMPVVSELGVATVLAAVTYFAALGILLVFVERIDSRAFLSLVLGFAVLSLGLVSVGETGLSAVVCTGLGALATDQAIEALGGA